MLERMMKHVVKILHTIGDLIFRKSIDSFCMFLENSKKKYPRLSPTLTILGLMIVTLIIAKYQLFEKVIIGATIYSVCFFIFILVDKAMLRFIDKH